MNNKCKYCGLELSLEVGTLQGKVKGIDVELDNIEAFHCKGCGNTMYTEETILYIRSELESL